MKKTIAILIIFTCTLLVLWSCKENVHLPEQDESQYHQLYMPLAVNNPVEYTLPVSENVQKIIYGANVGGFGYPEEDIKVNFSVDQSFVASYNEANGTSYEILPTMSYTLSATEALISKGTLATKPLELLIKTSGDDAITMFQTYLLPLTISSSYKINEELQTTYYLITAEPNIADYPDYDRSEWKILEFSSEEANGEGPNNGKAIFVLDGNIQSFWHSQWQGANPGPPHHLTIDMGTVNTLHGINVTARQLSGASGKPQEVKVETSLDNVQWQEVAIISLNGGNGQQKKWLPHFVDARYFRLVILSSYGSSNAHLAELGAY